MVLALPGSPASMSHKLFSELGLSAELLKAIDKLGFEQAAPIQAEAIPALMSGWDVVGQSQTGSGKTAAFAIPAIEKTDAHLRAVQVLILCPTRELAVQVSEEVHKLAVFKRGVRALPIYGGQSYERQFAGLREGVQIVIGTPGRVMDHMRRGTLRLESIRMAILDEVDVMLNMGFRDDIELILQGTPAARQTVFFSATIPRPIQDLIQRYARQPQQIRIEQKAVTVPTVEQVYYEVDRRFKIELLTRLIDLHDYKLGIIFCNTKRMVDDLVEHLNAQGYSADRLHGDMSQNLRDRVMNRFRKSGLEFLVATDVAARGLDVDDVQVVVNYDLPYDGEDYVHRIGRTGRAGRSGCAISFVSGRELFQIQQIERYTRTRIHRSAVPTPDEVQAARTNVFLGRLRATLQRGEFEKQDEIVGRLLEEGFTSTDIASALIHQLQNEGAPPPREEPPPDRIQRRVGREDRRQWPDRPRVEIRERPVLSKEGDRPLAREQRRTEEPAAQPQSPTEAPTAKTAPKQGGALSHQGRRTQTQSTRENVRIPVAPARRDSRHPVRFEEPSPRASRKSGGTPKDKTRLYMNVGEEMNIAPEDVVNAILGETGLPRQVVGKVDVRERHLFADVASEHAHAIIGRLNRSDIKGRRIKVKLA
jgi:ATP-dependent RNA helicase DeaD